MDFIGVNNDSSVNIMYVIEMRNSYPDHIKQKALSIILKIMDSEESKD